MLFTNYLLYTNWAIETGTENALTETEVALLRRRVRFPKDEATAAFVLLVRPAVFIWVPVGSQL